MIPKYALQGFHGRFKRLPNVMKEIQKCQDILTDNCEAKDHLA